MSYHIKDISEHLPDFVLAWYKGELVGVVRIEVLNEYGLLRSLAVRKSYRNMEIAKELYIRTLALAHIKGVRELYLLTTTADKYFLRLGFRQIQRDFIPEPIQNTKEFHRLCSSLAICMMRYISCCNR